MVKKVGSHGVSGPVNSGAEKSRKATSEGRRPWIECNLNLADSASSFKPVQDDITPRSPAFKGGLLRPSA